MSIKLSKNLRRAAAILILLTLLISLGAAIVLPLMTSLTSHDDAIADLGFRLQKYQRMAQMERPLKTQLFQLNTQRDAEEGLLKGESAAIAGANLQAILKQRVLDAGGRLDSTQILPSSLQGAMEWIGIRAQFSGDMESLQHILYAIEFDRTFLFVDKLEMRTRNKIRRSRRAAQPAAKALSVSMEVFGYRRRGDNE